MLTLFACALYLATAILCLLSARARPGGQRAGAEGSRRRFWLYAGAFFAALAAMRVSGAEDAIRGALRAWLVADGEYGARRTIQGPIVAAVLCALVGLALWARRATKHSDHGSRGPAVIWARRGVAAMAVLIVVRLISFHPVDVLLYRKLHLNWIIDLGSTLLVAASAIVSLRRSTESRPRRNERRN